MPRAVPGDRPQDMHPLGAQRLTCVEGWAGRAMLFELLRNSLNPMRPAEEEAHAGASKSEDDYHKQLAYGPGYSLNDTVARLAYTLRWLGEMHPQEEGDTRRVFDAVAMSLSDVILLRAAALDQLNPGDDEGPL